MGVTIDGISKPKNCRGCWFNSGDCWCSITHGGIDRDDYSCDKPCPIHNKSEVEIRQMIDDISGHLHLADFDQVKITTAEYNEQCGWLNALRWVLGELCDENNIKVNELEINKAKTEE